MKVNGRMNEIKYVQDLDISELVKSELIHEPWQIISENLRYQNLDLNDYEAALKIGPEGIEIIREQLTEIIRHRKVQEIMIVNFILKIEPIY
jgi:translation initiation factor 2 alpha subunit (eIF-2alpha)